MEKFMGNIVMYGLSLGTLLAIIFISIYIKKMKINQWEDKVTVHLLPFLGVAFLFAVTGYSAIIQSIYYASEEIEKIILGSISCIPLFIIVIKYISNYKKENKCAILEAEEKKYNVWK